MKVTGLCTICNTATEDVAHALAHCPHSRRLWQSMRECWLLPHEATLQVSSSSWFRIVLLSVPVQMVDHLILVAWRTWYERNEVTHDKPLPSTESSKKFLCNYERILGSIKHTPVDHILKGNRGCAS
jgi:hypothetical protein